MFVIIGFGLIRVSFLQSAGCQAITFISSSSASSTQGRGPLDLLL